MNNSRGLQTSRTEAFGTPQARTITTTWHTTFRLPTQIVEPGRTTDFTYDTSGNLLTKTETDTTTQSVPYSTNGQTHTWTWTYDSLGDVLTETGPRTDVTATTTYTYPGTAKNLATVTDALGHVTNITSYDNAGRPLSLTDPNGTVTNLTYDPLGRLLTQVVAPGTAYEATTTLGYNAAGLLTSIQLPDGTTLNYEYDDAQRLKAVTKPVSSGTERIDYTLDNAGNITQETIKNSSGTLRYQQSHTFDALGRLLTDVGYLSAQTTTYAYDGNGNRISATDARSNTTSQAFDPLNRLITVTDPLTKVATTTWDSADNTTGQTDFRNLTTNYVYNGFHQVIQVISPEMSSPNTLVYTLDKAGNRIKEVDARNVETDRTFDKLDRVLTETFPASTSENIAYTYDSVTGGNKGIGHLTGFSDESGSTAFTYDPRGNVIQKTQTIGTQNYTTSYAYNAADRVTLVTYPSGRQVQYNYKLGGYLSSVNTRPSSSGSYAALAGSVNHEAFGPLSNFLYGNGQKMTRTTNKNFQITAIKTANTDGSSVRQDLALGYDDAGNLTSVTDNLNSSRSQTATYDALNRISQTASTGSYGTVNYTYDDNSNRKTRQVGSVTDTYTYASASNRLSSIALGAGGTRSFTYKTNGNLTSDTRGGTTAFQYSNRNRMNKATVGGATVGTYLYNALGERASKTASGATTHYLYDEDGRLIAEANGATGATIREYVWLEDMIPLAQIEASSGAVSYILADQLGTPQKMTDATTAIVWDRQQQPFGETVATSGTASSNLRFPGQIADAESGLNYNFFRDYDPTLGRYIEFDLIGQAGGLQPYGYARQNPLVNIDPSGLITEQMGGYFNFNFPGYGQFNGGAGITVDDMGNFGFYYYGGGSAPVVNTNKAPSISGGINLNFSNADSICDLEGPFFNQSYATPIAKVGVDTFEGKQGNGKSVIGGGVSVGIGVGPLSSVGATDTIVKPLTRF